VGSILKSAIRFPFVIRARARDAAAAHSAKYNLTVVAIFREEAPFLNEWLEFHAGVGVEHFYLYNNFSTDGFQDVLAPWIAQGLVSLTDWPVQVGQLPAYRHCVRSHADEARWMAFIDIDEFLFSPEQVDVRSILADYGDLPGVIVHSPYFGASGHDQRPEGPLVEALTRRAPLTLTSVKTIANPRWIYAIRSVHYFKYWAGEALDTNRQPLRRGYSVVLDRLRLNHYWSRSLEDPRTNVVETRPPPRRAITTGTSRSRTSLTRRRIARSLPCHTRCARRARNRGRAVGTIAKSAKQQRGCWKTGGCGPK
jgi:hypothetical protein